MEDNGFDREPHHSEASQTSLFSEQPSSGETSRTQDLDGTSIHLYQKLNDIAAPEFDPEGYLMHYRLPSGIGEHTVLQVLNLFLDGVGAQLGLPNVEVTPFVSLGERVAEPADTVLNVQAPCDTSAGVRSETVSRSPSCGGGDRNPTTETSEALSPNLRLTPHFPPATSETTLPESHDRTQNPSLNSVSQGPPKGFESNDATDVMQQKATLSKVDVLHCVRCALRRVLSGWEAAPSVVDVVRADASEVARTLWWHFSWLWQSLQSFWPFEQAVSDALDEVLQSPLAKAKHVATDEPPWPEVAMSTCLRTAEELLASLLVRTASSAPEASSLGSSPPPVGSHEISSVERAAVVGLPQGLSLDSSPPQADPHEPSSVQQAVKVELPRALSSSCFPPPATQHESSLVENGAVMGVSNIAAGRNEMLDKAEAWLDACKDSIFKETVSYPCGVTLRLLDFAGAFCKVAAANDLQRVRVLKEMSSENCKSFLRSLLRAFQSFNKCGDGMLKWEQGGICDFVAGTFHHRQLHPPTEGQTRQLFLRFDRLGRGTLEARECISLADACFRAAFFKPAADVALAEAEQWVSSLQRRQDFTAAKISYSGGRVVNIEEVLGAIVCWTGMGCSENPLSEAVRTRIIKMSDDGSLLFSALKVYRQQDIDSQGFLKWQNGQVAAFVGAAFKEFGLMTPSTSFIRDVVEQIRKSSCFTTDGTNDGNIDCDDCDRVCMTPCESLCVFDVALRVSLIRYARNLSSTEVVAEVPAADMSTLPVTTTKSMLENTDCRPSLATSEGPVVRRPQSPSLSEHFRRTDTSLSPQRRVLSGSSPQISSVGVEAKTETLQRRVQSTSPPQMSSGSVEANTETVRKDLKHQDVGNIEQRSRVERERQVPASIPIIRAKVLSRRVLSPSPHELAPTTYTTLQCRSAPPLCSTSLSDGISMDTSEASDGYRESATGALTPGLPKLPRTGVAVQRPSPLLDVDGEGVTATEIRVSNHMPAHRGVTGRVSSSPVVGERISISSPNRTPSPYRTVVPATVLACGSPSSPSARLPRAAPLPSASSVLYPPGASSVVISGSSEEKPRRQALLSHPPNSISLVVPSSPKTGSAPNVTLTRVGSGTLSQQAVTVAPTPAPRRIAYATSQVRRQ